MYVLTKYLDSAVALASYQKLEDGTYAGRISACAGVIAFGQTRAECSDELRSALEDWVLLGIKLGHSMPVLAGIDLNQEPTLEPVGTL